MGRERFGELRGQCRVACEFAQYGGEPAPDPTCYIAAPARTEPGVAPPGGEALYILAHTPYLRPHHDWQAMFPGYRQIILDKLKRCAGMPDIECAHCVLRIIYNPNKPTEPVFHQCADIALVRDGPAPPSGVVLALATLGSPASASSVLDFAGS